jgi:basic membrane lipoprotein Med (substrate-binding protein (PBP1-ABC) superfamily)
MNFFRASTRRAFSSATGPNISAGGIHDPNGLFSKTFTSPAKRIAEGLAVAVLSVVLVNVFYRRPQMKLIADFNEKLKQCHEQGIFDAPRPKDI